MGVKTPAWADEHRSEPHAAESASRASVGKNVLTVVVSTVVLLCVLELGVRLYAYAIGRGFSDNPNAFISPFFTTDESPAPYRDGDFFVFKEKEHVPVAKPPGEIRVVCLGGSTTLPGRDAEGFSYPHHLETLLAPRFPEASIRVLNAGGNGFSSAHSLVNLALRILEVQPDVVTVYDNINDLSVNYFGDRATSDYGNKYMTTHYLGYRHRSGLWSNIERASRLMRLVGNRLEMLDFEYENYDPTRDYHSGLPYFERNLRSIVAVARAHGVSVVLGTQTARSTLRTSEAFKAYNDTIRRVAEETGVGLAEVADGVIDDRYFVDDVHNTSAGARAVAERWLAPVSEVVRARLSERTAAAPGALRATALP